MIDINKLKGAMVSAGYSSAGDAAKAIGMSEPTMYRKLRKGIFGSDEIEAMIDAFGIQNPVEIFFAKG